MGAEKSGSKNGNRKVYFVIGLAGQVTLLLVAPVVGSLVLGFWLDNYFHTSPIFIIGGVFLGFAGSIFNVFRIMKIVDKT